MAFIIDEHNFAYFTELPPEARLATLDDFHWHGKRHSNMPFICHSRMYNHFTIYRFRDSIPAGRLKFFVDLGMIYVFNPVPQCVTDYLSNP
jgi:hypothetical protein